MDRQLTPQELQKLRNNRTGLFLFQVSWMLVFVSLVVVNLLMRGNFQTWPPPGVAELPVALPVVATLLLLVSSFLVRRGFGALKAGELAGFAGAWRLTLALGLAFTAIMAYEWLIVPDDAGQYGAIFRLMTAFHGVHALAIGFYLLRVVRFALAGVYRPGGAWEAEAGVKLWDFVTIAWALFFVILYII